MPRNITITFADGSGHRYENIPDNVTPDMIETRINKDFPGKRITNIDGGRGKSAAQAQPSTQQSNKQNQSQFSIKGLRFGMSLEEVLAVTNASEDDYSQRMDMKTYSYPKRPTKSEWRALNGFSIAGSQGWNPIFENNQLVSIYKSIVPSDFKDWYDIFASAYGKGQLSSEPIGTAMGFKSTNYTASWKNKDANIFIYRYSNRITEGLISLSWDKWSKDLESRATQSREKARKDFE